MITKEEEGVGSSDWVPVMGRAFSPVIFWLEDRRVGIIIYLYVGGCSSGCIEKERKLTYEWYLRARIKIKILDPR